MMKKGILPKLLLMLMFAMTVSVINVAPAFAIGNYGANIDSDYYSAGNPFRDYRGQCTWYAYGRAYEKTGTQLGYRGNANCWTSSAVSTPRANSVAVWTKGETGHVAFVEAYDGNVIYISECNRVPGQYSEGTINLSTRLFTYTCGGSGSYYVDLPDGYTYCGSDSGSGSSFVSYVDDIHGEAEGIYFKGWTFNKNNLTRSTQVHVYLDGPLGQSTTSWAIDADVARTDVDAVHHVGAYHGFDTTINGISPGNHTVYLYANDQYLSQHDFIGSYSVYVTGSAPVCTDFHVGELREGAFTVMSKVTAKSGVKEVKYAIWTEKDGQDDIRWYQGNHTDNNNIWWARVDFGDHNWERGNYIIHLYAYSNSGELTNPGITYAFKESGPEISNVTVSDVSASGYTVTCTVADVLGVLRVQFPTWTTANDQDDCADNWQTNEQVRGSLTANTATFRVNASDHNGEGGVYRTHIYAYDILGNQSAVAVPDVYLHDHSFKKAITPATTKADGVITEACSVCNEVRSTAKTHKIASIALSKTSAVFDGIAQKPTVKVTDSAGKTIDSRYFSVTYPDGLTNAGTYRIGVSFNGLYSGSANLNYSIAPASISSASVAVLDQTYTGKALTPQPTVKIGSKTLKKDVDYTVSYKNNINVGTATVVVAGKGNYSGSKASTFKINSKPKARAISLAKASITGLKAKAYTGKRINQLPVVKLGSKTLKKGTDYAVSYKNNKNVGTATVTITGKGNYGGTAKATFKITRAANKAAIGKTSVKKTFTTSKLKKKEKVVTLPKVTTKSGKAKWRVVTKDKKGVLTLKSGKVQVKKGAKKGTYTIKLRARVAKTKNYKAANSKTVTIKVTVKAAKTTSSSKLTAARLQV